MIAMRSVSKKKTAASTVEIFANSWSSPFFFPKNCSEAPPMTPETPALLLDCIKITAMRPRQTRTSTIVKKIYIAYLHKYVTVVFYHIRYSNTTKKQK